MTTRRISVWVAGILIALCCKAVDGQGSSSVILVVDVENLVQYHEDISDVSKFATNPNITTAVVPKDFHAVVIIGDIVAVNGQPAKGTVTRNVRTATLTTAPNPGAAIADTVHNGLNADVFEILKRDGTSIGAIMSLGLGGGDVPAGAPLALTGGNLAIVGGTGAFLGARGQDGTGVAPQGVPSRQASFAEDPANRRRNGGGRARFVLQVIPMFRPEVVMTSGVPAVFHGADLSPVTAAKPAAAGEVVILMATGLGPTRPGVDPGQPFPSSQLHVVNSPVDVIVNGASGGVISATGWPGRVDTYRVEFRVPPGTAAVDVGFPGVPSAPVATIQLSAAWIAGPSVNIPIR
jgi:uncharacterized protein (TIGR03437 family)